MMSKATSKRVKRPFGFVILVTIIGCLLISGIIAFVSYQFFYMVLLFPALMGLAGGIFAWVVFEERNLQGTWWAALGGVLGGAFIFIAYRYISYLLAMQDISIELSFWDYTRSLAAGGTELARRPGSAGIALGQTMFWLLWLVEFSIVMICGGYLGKKMDDKV